MEFKVENGSNHISIGLSDIGSYFRFDNPLSLVWYDNRGSVGKYFCLLPYNQIYRDELEINYSQILIKIFLITLKNCMVCLSLCFPYLKMVNIV